MRKKTERTRGRGGGVRETLSVVRMQLFAWEKKRFCEISDVLVLGYVTFALDLDLQHTLDADAGPAGNRRVVCKFGGDRTICLIEEAIYRRVNGQTDRHGLPDGVDGRRAIVLAEF